jgi:Beta-ketoacyl synthase, N-terminal domain
MSELALARWAAWLPGVETPEAWRAWASQPRVAREPAAPRAEEVPALLRRRCDALARALLHVAGECCEPALRAQAATVFATRFGPLGAITENLEALARNAPLSPTTFSHAVHNTALGLFSIWAQNRAPGTALAAGEGTFAHGWLEAALLAGRERTRPVLLVAGDAALPSSLAQHAPFSHGPYAVALLLRADGLGERVRFQLAPRVERASVEELPQALAFLRWWIAGTPSLQLASERHTSSWQRG